MTFTEKTPAALVRAVAGLSLAFCTACADPDVATLVRFQGAPPRAAWSVLAAADAGSDAAPEQEDASSPEPLDASEHLADANASAEDSGQGENNGDASKPVTACKFSVTTAPLGGRYAPRNIGAIWIERANGEWVKTLAVWAGVRQRYLTTYLKTNTARNTMDAVTSATLRQHKSHEVTWNLSDGDGKVVPNGSYRLRMELTDNDSTGELLTVPFDKSSQALELSPEATDGFVAARLSCS